MRKSVLFLFLGASLAAAGVRGGLASEGEAVDTEALKKCRLISEPADKSLMGPVVFSPLLPDDILPCLKGVKRGFELEFSAVDGLRDRQSFEYTYIDGRLAVGPLYRLEDGLSVEAFASAADIVSGKVLVNLEKFEFPEGKNIGAARLRMELCYGNRRLGMVDVPLAFKRTESGYFVRIPCLSEGPFVNMAADGKPGEALISFKTDAEVEPRIALDDGRSFAGPKSLSHEIKISGLKPSSQIKYKVSLGEYETPFFSASTAPDKGSKGPVTFAVAGGPQTWRGFGEDSFAGVGRASLGAIARQAAASDAAFLLWLGDHASGSAIDKREMSQRLRVFKSALAPFWSSRPVLATAGQGGTLCDMLETPGKKLLRLDKRPADKDGVERMIAEEFAFPDNGPAASDKRRPPYKRNVYSFSHGPVRVIVANNSYWFSSDAESFGGCPTGCVMDDQMEWIEKELDAAEKDAAARHVFVAFHNQLLPPDGNGDNRPRARTFSNGKMEPQKTGLLEQRNRLLEKIGASPKVAAVLQSGSDGCARMVVDKTTPVGVPSDDDKDKNSVMEWASEPASPLKNLKSPVWHISTGAVDLGREKGPQAPWLGHAVKNGAASLVPAGAHMLIFRADGETVSMRAVDICGREIDTIPDLLKIKKN